MAGISFAIIVLTSIIGLRTPIEPPAESAEGEPSEQTSAL
jgi:hypothetical protein